MPAVNWNVIGRIIISILLIGVAFWVIVYSTDRAKDALAVSLVGIIAGFWLHELPDGSPG